MSVHKHLAGSKIIALTLLASMLSSLVFAGAVSEATQPRLVWSKTNGTSNSNIASRMLIQCVTAETEKSRVEWNRTYPRATEKVDYYYVYHEDGGSCFVQTSDGGYAIVGNGLDRAYRSKLPDDTYTGMIVKTDSSGNLSWRKINPIFSFPQSIFQTKDLGYVIVAHNWYLLKTDEHGNVQWNKTWGVSLSWGIQASDGDYVLAGTNQKNALLMKTDEDGNLLWNKTLFSFPSTTVITSNLVRTDDGGYAMIGYRSDYQSLWYDPNLYIIKTDRDGNLQLGMGYFLYYEPKAGSDPNGAQLIDVSVTATTDGGYIIAGGAQYYFRTGGDYLAPFFAKIDSQGKMLWNYTYANNPRDNSYFSSVVQTADGGYFAAGSFSNAYPLNFHGASYDTPLLIKIGAVGDPAWNQTFSSVEDYHMGSSSLALITNDGGYAVVGSLDGSVWLAKFAPESAPPPSNETSFSTTLIVAVVVVVAIVIGVGLLVFVIGVGLLVYFWKRKH